MSISVNAEVPVVNMAKDHMILQAMSLLYFTGSRLIDILNEQFTMQAVKSIIARIGIKNRSSLFNRGLFAYVQIINALPIPPITR